MTTLDPKIKSTYNIDPLSGLLRDRKNWSNLAKVPFIHGPSKREYTVSTFQNNNVRLAHILRALNHVFC